MQHLAVFDKGYIEKILAGKKKVEARFSKFRFAPFKKVKKGDEIFLKKSGGKVLGKFTAGSVLSFENLNVRKITEIRRKYEKDLKVDGGFWEMKKKSKYATLVFIKDVEKFPNPIALDKHDRRSWVVLSDIPGYSSKFQLSLKFSDRDSISNLTELIKFLKKEKKIVDDYDLRDMILKLSAEVGELSKNVSEKRSNNDTAKFELADVMIQLVNISDRLGVDLFELTKKRIQECHSKISLDKLKNIK
ncbi:MAG: hypothetical protein ACD_63C00054G0002 [uncultured bacterium]|nr:MAG: hypothetical protein ACD_63C00054G0002 [uncultured bacterium]